MSGRKIDDHAFWAGKPEKGGVFPRESRMKEEHSASSAGAMSDYPDTTEDVHRDQSGAASKLKSKPLRPGYRY